MIEYIGRYPELLIVLPVAAFVAGILLAWQVGVWWRSRRGRAGHGRGKRAEKRAGRLLEKAGFRILEKQPRFDSELLVEGRTKRFTVTPDFLVALQDREYVVEVKRQTEGNSIHQAGIRRQVIEYLIATGRPCLLIRMPEGLIEEIELPE